MVLEAETAAILTGRRKGSVVEGTTFADAPRRPPSPPPPAAPEPDYPQSQYAHTEVAVPDIVCYDCGSGEDSASNPILLCDGSFPGGAECPQAFHLFCLEPVIALSDVLSAHSRRHRTPRLHCDELFVVHGNWRHIDRNRKIASFHTFSLPIFSFLLVLFLSGVLANAVASVAG